jgi:hypothetical protein
VLQTISARSPSPSVASRQIFLMQKLQGLCTYYWWEGLSCSQASRTSAYSSFSGKILNRGLCNWFGWKVFLKKIFEHGSWMKLS